MTKNSLFISLSRQEYLDMFVKLFEADKLTIITYMDVRWGDEFIIGSDVNPINHYTKLKKFKDALYDKQENEDVWVIMNLFRKGTQAFYEKEIEKK